MIGKLVLAVPAIVGVMAASSSSLPGVGASHAAIESGGTITVQGTELRYLRAGKGPALVVIGASAYYSRLFPSTLANDFDVVYADSRHFVGAYQPTADQLQELTLDTFAEDVEAVRQALRLPRIAVVGHSVHAQIALRYAQRHPDRTSHLILVCGMPYGGTEFTGAVTDFWEKDASAERKALLARNREELKIALARTPANRTFAVSNRANGPRYWADPRFDAAALLEGLENNAALDRLFAVVPSSTAVRAAFEHVKVPIYVAVGRYDYAAPYVLWQRLTSGVPNVRLQLFEQSGHNPQMEQADAFERALIDWFKGAATGA